MENVTADDVPGIIVEVLLTTEFIIKTHFSILPFTPSIVSWTLDGNDASDWLLSIPSAGSISLYLHVVEQLSLVYYYMILQKA